MATERINDVISHLEEIRKVLDEIGESLKKKEEELREVRDKLGESEKIRQNIEQEKEKLESRINELEKKLEESEKTRKEIEVRLSKVSSLYQELKTKSEQKVEVEDLLAIYIALLEKVFMARPHAKILWILHGENSEVPLRGLIDATGFSPTDVRHAIRELASAELVEYDAELGKVKLLKRIFE